MIALSLGGDVQSRAAQDRYLDEKGQSAYKDAVERKVKMEGMGDDASAGWGVCTRREWRDGRARRGTMWDAVVRTPAG
jgi:hypothetical protein